MACLYEVGLCSSPFEFCEIGSSRVRIIIKNLGAEFPVRVFRVVSKNFERVSSWTKRGQLLNKPKISSCFRVRVELEQIPSLKSNTKIMHAQLCQKIVSYLAIFDGFF